MIFFPHTGTLDVLDAHPHEDVPMAAGKIMPRFDMKEGRLVKGMHFVDIRDAGNPVEHALFSRNDGADELAVPGIASILGNRTTKQEWGTQVSSVTDIPLTVGCGIGSPADTEVVLGAGPDKGSTNSAAAKNPGLVREAATSFGSQRITVAVDAQRTRARESGCESAVSGGNVTAARHAVARALQCEELGAGVPLPTSMDGDGTLKGNDIFFTRAVVGEMNIPTVASVGAGTLEDFGKAAKGATRAS